MRTDKIIHFVYFETLLKGEEFITKWESYLRSANSDIDVTLQESKKNNQFMYIAQHRCDADEFQFTFTKAAKTNRSKQVEIKTTQLGGYSIIQEEQTGDAKKNESKVFVFLNYSNNDFEIYKQAKLYNKLNIYKAYYENCTYAYILEYFVKNNLLEQLQQQLQQYNATGISVYKECYLKTV